MQEETFILNAEFVRASASQLACEPHIELNQLLKLVGIVDSGGAGKALVAAGEVSVDGQLELRKTCKVRAGSVVTLGDVKITVIQG
jgi:ribosome-associated protein